MSDTIFRIISNGSADELQLLLDQDTRALNEGDEDNVTPLHLAVGMRREDMVKLLLGFGAEVNAKTLDSHLTPLHLAVRDGHLTIIDLLLDHGADINCCNKIHHTPLHIAVSTLNIEVVRLLLFWNADPDFDTYDPRSGSPLLKAATISLPITSLLLESGAKLSLDSHELHVAILANKPDIALFLLDAIDQCNYKNEIQLKPNKIMRSHLQSLCSHIRDCDHDVALTIARRLVSMGGDVNYSNQYGTVFHILVNRGEDSVSNALFDFFLSIPGADCDVQLPIYGTPLSLALRTGNLGFAWKLLKEGFADPRKVQINQIVLTTETARIMKYLILAGFRCSGMTDSQFRLPPNADDESVTEFLSWYSDITQSVLPLKALIRIFLRIHLRNRCKDLLSLEGFPSLLCNYVNYRGNSRADDFS